MEGTVLEEAYNILLYSFMKVVDFVFNYSEFYVGGFTFGNLIITASLAWIVIKFITKSMLNVERETHREERLYHYRKDTYSE